MNTDLSQQIVAQLKQTRKYRFLCADTLFRVARWAQVRYGALKPAVKVAKRKLHQVYGAYLESGHLDRVDALVEALPADAPPEQIRATCRQVLQCHASTAERLPLLDRFYSDLFERIGRPRSLLDLACGLHPFALPWMGLGPQVDYYACDIDLRVTASLRRFFSRVGQCAEAVCQDILVDLPNREVDVAFLLKTLPCLEQQEKGVGLELLRQLRASCLVVSFPNQSLGGRRKGMAEHYDAVMARILDHLQAKVHRMAYAEETIYVLEK